MAASPSSQTDDGLSKNSRSVGTTSSILDSIIGSGILWASVPKARRTREKRLMRKHAWTGRMEYYQLRTDLINCPDCGSWHERAAICGKSGSSQESSWPHVGEGMMQKMLK